MPIYGFKCNKCKHEFEVVAKIDEQVECPQEQCKSTDLTKQLSTFSRYNIDNRGTGSVTPKKYRPATKVEVS